MRITSYSAEPSCRYRGGGTIAKHTDKSDWGLWNMGVAFAAVGILMVTATATL
jgi:hypothetical protein